ncbi:MAG: GyrI-like domain-containing protein, partial [Verrucomicrobiales bacterium]
FMKKMMCRFIEMDYDRGLLMLKDLLERGEVLSKLTFSPRVAVASTPYVGITRECPIAELGDHMEGDFKKLRDWSLDKGLSPCRPPFSIYEKWDLKKGLARYTAAYPLDEIPDELPDGAARGELPACESFVVTHQGSYHHLGNAWTAGMMRAKAKAFRQSRRIMPFETYPNNPDNTAEEDLLALVHFPLK